MPVTFFGQALASLRDAKGMSKYEVVKTSGLDKALYKRIENGDRLPTDDALRKLAPAFGMNYIELKSLTVDDVLGPDDLAVLAGWFQQEAEDRQYRQSPNFWLSLTHADLILQFARMAKGIGYQVHLAPEPEAPAVPLIDLILERDDKNTLVTFRTHGPIDRDEVLHVENERVVQGAVEAWIVAPQGFHPMALEAAAGFPVRLSDAGALVGLSSS